MPKRRSHVAIGMAAALLAGQRSLTDVPSDGQLAFLGGLALGGAAGGITPDQVEPAEHPHHRGSFHSLAALAAILWLMHDHVPAVSDVILRTGAELHSRRTNASCPGQDQSWLALQEQACYFAAGALRGFGAGYASHLLADAVTPRSVPLLARNLV